MDRRVALLTLILVLSLLVGSTLGPASTDAATTTGALALTPASALAVIRFAPAPGQWLRLQALQEKLATVPEIRAAMEGGQRERIGRAMTVENDVLPWLGGDVALAVLPPSAASASDPDLAVLLASRDVRGAERFLRDLRTEIERSGEPMRKRETAGVTFYARGAGPALGMVRGFVLLSTSTDRLKEMILIARGRGQSLGDSAAYQAIAGLLPPERLGEIYIAPDLSGGSVSVERVANRGVAVSARLTSSSLVWETVAPYDLERMHPDMRAWVQQPPNPLGVAAALPDATVAALAVRDIPALWRATTAVVRDEPTFQQSLADFEAGTGFNLEHDLLGWLSGEVGLGLIADPAFTGGLPVGEVLAIEARDRPLVEAKLARITDVLAQRHKITLSPHPLDGGAAQVVDTAGPAQGVGYTFAGDYLLIGSSVAMLRESVVGRGDGLAANPRYVAVREAMPPAVTSLAVVDMVAARQIAAAWAESQRQMDTWRAVEPWLRPLAAIGSASATVGADGIGRSTAVVVFDFAALGVSPSLDDVSVATSLAVAQVGLWEVRARLRAAVAWLGHDALTSQADSWLDHPRAALDAWLAERPAWAAAARLGATVSQWRTMDGP
ncbi:MAG: DUF3352 domain-containing protein [Chloroflexi bacterium]|nr:DUF3352 domain-containing protein [Chloroflexota bacterium]